MRRVLTLAIACGLLLVAAVSANSGPPQLPKDHKFVEPVMRFEGVEKFPDWVFHLQYTGSYREMFNLALEVTDGHDIKIEFSFNIAKDRRLLIGKMNLVAMQRKTFDERKKSDASFRWMDDKTSGALVATIKPPPTSAPINANEIPAIVYRVSIKDGTLTAVQVEDAKLDLRPPTALLPTWGFGIISSLSIAWLGIWFARRGAALPKPEK